MYIIVSRKRTEYLRELKIVSQFGNVRKQQQKWKIAQTTKRKKKKHKNYETRRENSISYIKKIYK